MINILDSVEKSARKQFGHFQPSTTEEFFAMRLAAKLGEPAAARHFAHLASQHSQAQILSVYRHVAGSPDLARKFQTLLQSMRARSGWSDSSGRLAGIRIERRAVAIAVLNGDHLVYADARQLSTTSGKALFTAAAFVARLLEKLRCRSVVLESMPPKPDAQKHEIQRAVAHAVGTQGAGIREVSTADVLAAFSYPAVKFRRDVRDIVAQIYPSLREMPGLPWTLDAAALALYAHTEHLLNINETSS